MEELDSLIQIIGLPAYFFDMASHRLLSVNQSFATMMEYEETELLNMNVGDLRPPEEFPKLLKALSQSPPEGMVEWRYRTKPGTLLNVRLSYRKQPVLRQGKPEALRPKTCGRVQLGQTPGEELRRFVSLT